MKKIKSAISLVCAMVTGFSLVGCNTSAASSGDNHEAKVVSYVNLEINPSIELTVDEENKIVSVYAANEDAQVLLYEEVSLEGLNVETAVEKITELAVEYGYLDEDNKVVGTTVSGEKAEELRNKINTKITATAKKTGLTVSIDEEKALSLIRKYEEFIEANPEWKDSVTIEQFKLALSASESGEITLEAALELDETKLINMISKAHKKIEKYATKAYDKIKKEAFAVYDKAVAELEDTVYATYYAKLAMENPLEYMDTYWYGTAYLAYRTAEVGFESIADAIELAEDVEDYEIPEEQAKELAADLGVPETEIEKMKDDDGKITIDSVEEYADKAFKNHHHGNQEFDKDKFGRDFKDAIGGAEKLFKGEVDKAKEACVGQIQALEAKVQMIINGLPLAKDALTAALADFNAIAAELKEDIQNKKEITEEQIEEYAEKCEEKAEEFLELIQKDLTEEQLAEVQKLKENLKEQLAAVRKTLEDKLAAAEKDAKDMLSGLKDKRKNGK